LKKRFTRAPAGGTRFEVLDHSPWPDFLLAPLAAAQGTLIILHGLAPHLSYANRSPKSRHAFALHIIDGACDYPADNWLKRSPRMPWRGFKEAID
jgi:phytanoyl-CoA hydroxylase